MPSSIYSSGWPACYPLSMNFPETPDLENGLLQHENMNIPDANINTGENNNTNSITSYNNELFSGNGEYRHGTAVIKLNRQTNVPIHFIVRYLLSPLIIWILWNRIFVVKLANTLQNVQFQSNGLVETFSVRLSTICLLIVAIDCMVPLQNSTIIGTLTQN